MIGDLIPKPMATVNGRPVLEILINRLIDNGIQKIILAVSWRAEVIVDYFGSSYRSVPIEYSLEERPMGTGGAFMKALDKTASDHVLVCNADTLTLIDYRDLFSNYNRLNSSVMVVMKHLDNSRFGSVLLNSSDKVICFGNDHFSDSGLVSFSGISLGTYIIKLNELNEFNFTGSFFSLEELILPYLAANNRLAGYKYQGYFMDIGVPDDYLKSQNYFDHQIN